MTTTEKAAALGLVECDPKLPCWIVPGSGTHYSPAQVDALYAERFGTGTPAQSRAAVDALTNDKDGAVFVYDHLPAHLREAVGPIGLDAVRGSGVGRLRVPDVQPVQGRATRLRLRAGGGAGREQGEAVTDRFRYLPCRLHDTLSTDNFTRAPHPLALYFRVGEEGAHEMLIDLAHPAGWDHAVRALAAIRGVEVPESASVGFDVYGATVGIDIVGDVAQPSGRREALCRCICAALGLDVDEVFP